MREERLESVGGPENFLQQSNKKENFMESSNREGIKIETELISERVVTFILTRSRDEFASLTVSRVAQNFNIDRCKLTRLFKKFTGKTLECYIKQERMVRAADMLMHERNVTVKDVARKMGFCNSDYFIQVFKKYFGVGPGKYKDYHIERRGMDRRGVDRRGHDRRQKNRRPPGGIERRKAVCDRRQGPVDRRSNARTKWIVIRTPKSEDKN